LPIEFECRRCGNLESGGQYKRSHFCLTCGTLLSMRPQPKHWLFQFNPKTYKWFGRMEETQEPEQWLIAQHSRLISKGDLVAIWSSGQKAGVYALGQISTNPEKQPLNYSQEKYFTNKCDLRKFEEKNSAWIEYSKVFIEKPLLQEECNRDKTLLDLQVFMNPQGTNFRLTAEQWYRLLELADKK
jgi:hypothetical protein